MEDKTTLEKNSECELWFSLTLEYVTVIDDSICLELFLPVHLQNYLNLVSMFVNLCLNKQFE